jgi:PAS domain S-box-containing protein
LSESSALARAPGWLAACAVAAVYLFAARLGAPAGDAGGAASASAQPFWPAAGWALWAAWRLGGAGLAGVAGAAAIDVLASALLGGGASDAESGPGVAVVAGLAIVAATTAQAWLGGWSVERTLPSSPRFGRAAEVVRFAGAAVLVVATSATAASLVIGFEGWTRWCAGGSLGVLAVAPALIVQGDPAREPWGRAQVVEAAALALSIATVLGTALLLLDELAWGVAVALALILPCAVWSALRLGIAGAASASAVAAFAAAAALHGRAIVAPADDPGERALALALVAATGWAALVFAGALEPRRRASAALARAREDLEGRLRQSEDELQRARRELRVESAGRERVERALRVSDAWLRTAAEHLPFELLALDPEGRCTLQNSRSHARWGELLGRPIDDLPLSSELRERWREHHRRALDGEIVLETVEAVVEGKARTFERIVAPIREGGTTLAVLAADVDSSERRELLAQLYQAQKMESIGRLAGGIAHDFNNMLTAILGYAEASVQEIPHEHPAAAHLHEIRRVASRAADLTRQLLLFSRKQTHEPRVVDVDELVLGVQRMLRRVIGEHIELVVAARAAPAFVKADPSQLEQVLLNLAVNARDAMPHGGRLMIATSCRVLDAAAGAESGLAPGEYVSLRVADNGSGMPPDVLARIFEPFFTTKSEEQGTGLGLAVAYAVVRQAGGHIRVESEVGRGTCFTILLPSCHEPADELDAAPRRPDAPRGHETLLVVEDEKIVRSVTAAELRSRGYQVLEASNGEEALSLARSYPGEIHCLLTDVVMPRMGGEELAERLRPERPRLRVVFASGYARELMERRPVREADTAFLPKPFQPQELSRLVRELLDR